MASNKTNLIARLQHWMDSVPGQTFLNYAYSWGAAVVILGTLFKLTHIQGANVMLFIGMGTEVFVFFLSGFDRPFDKKADSEGEEEIAAPASQQTVILGGGTFVAGAGAGVPVQPTGIPAAEIPVQDMPVSATGTAQLLDTVNAVNQELLQAACATSAPEVEEAMAAYVEQLKELTETLNRVTAQAEHMTKDSTEMEHLNRTLTGINAVYEMQLKSLSKQVATIDHIDEQTHRLADQIEELNGVYGRMVKALTVNMKNASAGLGE